MLKCPIIKDECWGADCVRWDKDQGKCSGQVEREAQAKMRETNEAILNELIATSKAYNQMFGYYQLLWKISLAQLLRDPTIPQEIKDALQHAQDAETAEKLLKEAGLL